MKSAYIVGILAGTALITFAEGPLRPSYRPPSAPPPAPPIVFRESAVSSAPWRAASIFYSIGDPTPEEQFYLELLNRARANPGAEAALLASTTDSKVLGEYRIWNVDLPLMISQFNIYPPAPPLALNARLSQAARRQTGDMFTNAVQAHVGSDGSDPGTRVKDTGYDFFTVGENIYANAESVFHGHAGFEVDWGPGPGGMQTPPGHRNSIHKAVFREVGMGVRNGMNIKNGREVGPQLVTQVFGTAKGATPFITGVVYYDLNGNQFYDPGEGVGGVNVRVEGVAAEALTALSGGYAVPVPGDGTYAVTFSGGTLTAVTRPVTVSDQSNQKVDYLPVYSPPVVIGPDHPALGRGNAYTISTVGGAMEYRWQVSEKIAARSEGAENGTNRLTVELTPGYDLIQGQIKVSGNGAFHLVHPQSGVRPQVVLLNPVYLIQAGSSLSFQSRLGWAAADQVARVQLSADGGKSWTDIYSQPGSNGRGETSFTQHSVALSPWAGQQIRLRWVYDFSSGGFFGQTEPEVGWYIDDIQILNASELVGVKVSAAAGGAFSFAPVLEGSFLLQASARVGHDFLDWGPVREVTPVLSSAPETRIVRVARVGAELELTVEILAGSPGSLTLQSKSSLSGQWENQASTVGSSSASQVVLRTALPPATKFYRVAAQ